MSSPHLRRSGVVALATLLATVSLVARDQPPRHHTVVSVRSPPPRLRCSTDGTAAAPPIRSGSQQYVTILAYPAAAPYDGGWQQYCRGTTSRPGFWPLLENRIQSRCGFTGGSSGAPWLRNYDGSLPAVRPTRRPFQFDASALPAGTGTACSSRDRPCPVGD